jgi:hypothetical protein
MNNLYPIVKLISRGMKKGKGKDLPITGHEDPEGK